MYDDDDDQLDAAAQGEMSRLFSFPRDSESLREKNKEKKGKKGNHEDTPGLPRGHPKKTKPENENTTIPKVS